MDLTGKNGLFAGDNININQNIGTRHLLLFEMKRFSLFIGNLAASIVENFSTQAEEQPLCKALIPGGGNCSGQIIFDVSTRFQTR